MLRKSLLITVLLLTSGVLLAACGAVATPRPPLEPTQLPNTLAPRAANNAATNSDGQAIAEAPTESPTNTPEPTEEPTEAPTEVPPTATSTATATATLEPTEAPTETAAATEDTASQDGQDANNDGFVFTGGDPAIGEELFQNALPQACITCHYVDVDDILIGPPITQMAADAITGDHGNTPEEYIYRSVLYPNEYIVEAPESRVYATNGTSLMYQNYAEYLSDEEINHLIAYVLTFAPEEPAAGASTGAGQDEANTQTADEVPGGAEIVTTGDAERGAELFQNSLPQACVTCHYVDIDEVLIGPPITQMAHDAITGDHGQEPVEYIQTSILEPNAYIAEAPEGRVFATNGTSLMYQNYAEFLTEDDINDLATYILSQAE